MSLVEKALEKMHESQRACAAVALASGPVKSAGAPSGVPAAAEASRPPPVPRRMVQINEAALRAAGMMAPESETRLISRQYRKIKRPLIAAALGRGVPALPNGRRIMVASANPGDGKTFNAINLAFSLAREKDLNVLLVDVDIPKPHVSRLFGIDNEPGLLDALRDGSRDVESFICDTSLPGLSLLPAGLHSDNATELLASERMTSVLDRLQEANPDRIMVFDSPPLLLTSESQALAQASGQILVIVRAGSTPQQALFDALDQLGEGRQVSLVLNQSASTSQNDYRYYYENDGTSSGDHTGSR